MSWLLDNTAQVAIAAIFSVGTLAVRALLSRFRLRLRLGHVARLLGDGPFSLRDIVGGPKPIKPELVVVFPTPFVGSWSELPPVVAEGQSRRLSNVLGMSLPDGAAITRIGETARRWNRRTEMVLTHPAQFRADGRPVVVIGAPDVNAQCGKLLRMAFPDFRNSWPDHEASYEGDTWRPEFDPDDRSLVIRDYGFILTGKLPARSTNFLALWGTTDFGTNIAARMYADLRRDRRDIHQMITAGETVLVVVSGKVEGYGVQTDEFAEMKIVTSFPTPARGARPQARPPRRAARPQGRTPKRPDMGKVSDREHPSDDKQPPRPRPAGEDAQSEPAKPELPEASAP